MKKRIDVRCFSGALMVLAVIAMTLERLLKAQHETLLYDMYSFGGMDIPELGTHFTALGDTLIRFLWGLVALDGIGFVAGVVTMLVIAVLFFIKLPDKADKITSAVLYAFFALHGLVLGGACIINIAGNVTSDYGVDFAGTFALGIHFLICILFTLTCIFTAVSCVLKKDILLKIAPAVLAVCLIGFTAVSVFNSEFISSAMALPRLISDTAYGLSEYGTDVLSSAISYLLLHFYGIGAAALTVIYTATYYAAIALFPLSKLNKKA